MRPPGQPQTEKPVIKSPVWTPEIPLYFYTGGLAGASAGVGLLAEPALARRAWLLALAGSVASPALLISDLGVPKRFMNMLRMFKVTSPMSVGSWVLVVSGGASNTAAALELAGKLRPLKWAAEVVSFLAGPPLATYTGTLLANTAIPVWQEARHELPYLFGASASASAGAATALLLPPDEAGPARRLAIAGVAAELGLMELMERRLGFVGEVYKQGAAGRLGHLSKAMTGAGAALLALKGRRSRAASVAGSALVLGGELALRWSVFKAGFQSARDPRYTVIPQRERLAKRR
ncbi:MAG: NrfD/PsrC family molybdoenzyme membrane anchor subunit [Gaiellaceae bacterium]